MIVILRAFTDMDTGSIFMKGIIAVKPENETALLKDFGTHGVPFKRKFLSRPNLLSLELSLTALIMLIPSRIYCNQIRDVSQF
jgi:hypothetical protein